MDRLVETTTDRQETLSLCVTDKCPIGSRRQLIAKLIRVTNWPMLGTVRSLQLTADEWSAGG